MKELRGYFSVFSEIKEQVALAANQVAMKTAEIVKERSTHRLKLDIDIANPIIIVPQASDNETCYLSLDLGKFETLAILPHCGLPLRLPAFKRGIPHLTGLRPNCISPLHQFVLFRYLKFSCLGNILIKNSFEEQSENIIMDTLTINFQQLNVLTYQDSFKSTFFAKTDLLLSVIRPLSKNEDLIIPNSNILVHVDNIKLDFQEKILGLFVGILSNNFSEEVPCADINEVKHPSLGPSHPHGRHRPNLN